MTACQDQMMWENTNPSIRKSGNITKKTLQVLNRPVWYKRNFKVFLRSIFQIFFYLIQFYQRNQKLFPI